LFTWLKQLANRKYRISSKQNYALEEEKRHHQLLIKNAALSGDRLKNPHL
jgi:hypothetical protein